jgi:hypothetical protein
MALTTQLDQQAMDLEDTARIDRRTTILAQIEAALLADKLSLEATAAPATGADPYNSGTYKSVAQPGTWNNKRAR